jgi:hypothetical protein
MYGPYIEGLQKMLAHLGSFVNLPSMKCSSTAYTAANAFGEAIDGRGDEWDSICLDMGNRVAKSAL